MRAHACAHTCTPVHTHRRRRLTAVQAIAIRWRPTNRYGPLRLRQCWSLAIQINTRTGDPIYPRFFAYKHKLLGRTETRTRDRVYCQTIRIVRDISRDDRTRIATCSLRTLTDRLKENYSIDGGPIIMKYYTQYVPDGRFRFVRMSAVLAMECSSAFSVWEVSAKTLIFLAKEVIT